MSNSRLLPPSMRALKAFERVSQLGNVTRAAEELNTSQAAVSRHLRQLENYLGVSLIQKSGRGIVLTEEGRVYAEEVSVALSGLHAAGEKARNSLQTLVIACTHEVSHLILMPRYAALKKALGPQVYIRFLTCEYSAIPAMVNAGADIVFQYLKTPPQLRHASILKEEVMPLATPELIASQKDKLSLNPSQWHDIPRLELTKDNSGWALWDDWFESQSVKAPNAQVQHYDNYVYALDAAIRGEGLVLGWRGFADLYIQRGQLQPVNDHWLQRDTELYAVLTQNSVSKALAKKCLGLLTL